VVDLNQVVDIDPALLEQAVRTLFLQAPSLAELLSGEIFRPRPCTQLI
jgi:hypothetical protein